MPLLLSLICLAGIYRAVPTHDHFQQMWNLSKDKVHASTCLLLAGIGLSGVWNQESLIRRKMGKKNRVEVPAIAQWIKNLTAAAQVAVEAWLPSANNWHLAGATWRVRYFFFCSVAFYGWCCSRGWPSLGRWLLRNVWRARQQAAWEAAPWISSYSHFRVGKHMHHAEQISIGLQEQVHLLNTMQWYYLKITKSVAIL